MLKCSKGALILSKFIIIILLSLFDAIEKEKKDKKP